MIADQEHERPLFAFAGLWCDNQVEMQDPNTDRGTYTVITTTENALVRPIHPKRILVVLMEHSYDIWLYGMEKDALGLLRLFPSRQMRITK